MMWLVCFIGIGLFSLLLGAIWVVLFIDWTDGPRSLPRAKVREAYGFYFGFLRWFWGRLLGIATRWRR